jgi:hypothetical protein
MVIERYLHHVRVERPPIAETAAEARVRLGEKFPRASLRRMTHLGLLVGSTLDGLALAPDDALVYATTFSETRALEDYLGTFPAPSPLLFQTSIHPSAVQQVLIARQQPLTRFWPITGRARLVEDALLTALLAPAARCVIAGGEERGSWMLEQRMASERSFAFAIELTCAPAGAAARLEFRDAGDGSAAQWQASCPSLDAFADALAERKALAWRGANGAWTLQWL